MKNIKTIIIVIILILVGVLIVIGLNAAKTYLSGAAGGSEPNSVRVQADVKSATISWQTDKESQGAVEYGTTPASLLLRALESSSVVSHNVVLSPLKTGATYYFRIKVGETIYDNNGIPYSFKTKASEGEAGGGEPQAPTPTVRVPVPTKSSASPGAGATGDKVSDCVIGDFRKKFGTTSKEYDLDGNGIVNTKDWMKCLEDSQ